MEIFPITPENTLLISGEIDDWDLVNRYGVDTIIDMDGTIDPGVPEAPDRMLYIYFPILDVELPSQSKLNALGMMVANLIEEGHVVLIHCLMGLNRSNLVAAMALTYLGMDGRQAVEHLQNIQPAALYNENFADYIRELPARNIPFSAGSDP